MLDFVLGLALAALLVRGWVRGFVREILDLIGLVVGLWIAFRLSRPLGDFLTGAFGATPEVARVGAGIVLFVLFGAALSVAAHYLSRMMNLPGLNMANRVGGAAVAMAWGVALVLVLVNVVRVFPIPDSWEQALDESIVVEAIAGPDALPQEMFEALAGDSLLTVLATLQDVFGASRVVPGAQEIVQIPPAAPDEVRQVREDAAAVLERLNEYRAGEDLVPLQASDALTEVAESRALTMYTTGEMFLSDCVSQAAEVGIRTAICRDAVALAGTALGALDGIEDSEAGSLVLGNPGFDRAGVSVAEGPTGHLLVIVLAG